MKKILKQCICLMLTAIMIFSASVVAFADTGDINFQFEGNTYTYNRNYLDKPSNDFNRNLAICCLALIKYKTNKDTFSSLGFTSFTADSYSHATGKDGIYYSLAAMNDGDTTIVAITIEGTVTLQWYGNVSVGQGVDHENFCKARDTIYTDLTENFLPKVNPRSNIKFLVTGHSRGASTANLLAAKLNKVGSIGPSSFDKSDVYAYTFAPATTTTSSDAHSSDYDNIFNIVNRDDFVTVIPPAKMGFTLYGQIITLPSNIFNSNYSSMFSEMNACYKKANNANYTMIKAGASTPMIMAETMTELCGGTAEGYYNNKYAVNGQMYSCYDFMTKYADYRSNDPELMSEAESFFRSAANSEFGTIVKYATSGGTLWSSHYPTVYTAWLASLSDEDLMSKKTFNKVTLDTDAKIKVYTQSKKLVGYVNNGNINQYLSDSVTIVKGNNGYVIYLPGDADYSITLVGADKQCSYSYNVEFCNDTGISFNTISLNGNVESGKILSANVFATDSQKADGAYSFSQITSTPADDPKAPQPEPTQSIWQKIVSFFQTILNWFKSLFQ